MGALAIVGLLTLTPHSWGQGAEKPKVGYWPTPQAVVDRMLDMARVTKNDVVYDLGCGDGRIVVSAAKQYGARAVGVDIDPVRVQEALARVKAARVEELVTIRQEDLFKTDLTGASVVALYLNDKANLALMPTLKKSLKPGSRVVSQTWDMGEWKPDRTIIVDGIDEKENTKHKYTLYLWIIGKAEGEKDNTSVKGVDADERLPAVQIRDRFDQLRALIRPRPGGFDDLPWLTDLWEARKKAAEEGKPLLVWVGDGHPLGWT
jgi:SAM-dependent methyltransferase